MDILCSYGTGEGEFHEIPHEVRGFDAGHSCDQGFAGGGIGDEGVLFFEECVGSGFVLVDSDAEDGDAEGWWNGGYVTGEVGFEAFLAFLDGSGKGFGD